MNSTPWNRSWMRLHFSTLIILFFVASVFLGAQFRPRLTEFGVLLENPSTTREMMHEYERKSGLGVLQQRAAAIRADFGMPVPMQREICNLYKPYNPRRFWMWEGVAINALTGITLLAAVAILSEFVLRMRTRHKLEVLDK